jgi:cation diffusion facilitator CzcD-associated flavoprotein CzcO
MCKSIHSPCEACERHSDIQNRPATLYSYSFAQTGRWSTLKPSGKEICDYIRRVCEEHGLADNIQLNTEATDLRWDELREEWQITLARLVPGTGSLTQSERKTKVAAEGPESIYISREVARAKVVISAVGKFVEPRIELSHLPGFDRFEGEIIHTSRWNGDVDLRGKEIIVLGTGCSAAQLVPELGRARYGVKSITQLMRSPPWVGTEMLSPRLLGLWERHMPWLLQNVPGLKEAVRFIICAVTEFHYFLYIQPTAQASIRRQKQAKYLLRRMESLAPAGYHEILTPGYEVGCKRLIRDPKWLRSLQEPKVNLLDMELIRIAEAAVILESRDQDRPAQIRRPADVIILATGYENDTLLAYITVKGRNGIDLHMQWSDRGGLQAYLGLAVDNFPNLFFLNGPNTSSSHTSILITIENALHYVLKRIKPVLRGEVSSWEVHEETCKRWTYQVQRASKAGVWVGGGCTSWYVNEKGWNAMVYP